MEIIFFILFYVFMPIMSYIIQTVWLWMFSKKTSEMNNDKEKDKKEFINKINNAKAEIEQSHIQGNDNLNNDTDFEKLSTEHTSKYDSEKVSSHKEVEHTIVQIDQELINRHNDLKNLSLSRVATQALQNYHIRQFIIDGHMTVKQLCDDSFGLEHYNMLLNQDIRQFITQGYIDIDDFLCSSQYVLMALNYIGVRQLIVLKHISIANLLCLHPLALIAILNADIINLIIEGIIDAEQLEYIYDKTIYEAILDKEVFKLIKEKRINIVQLVNLYEWGIYAIRDVEVQQLFRKGMITVAQLELINSREMYDAITASGTIWAIMNNQLEIDVILGRVDEDNEINEYNRRQNTHTISIHESVSISVIKLYSHYENKIQNNDLDNIVKELTEHVLQYSGKLEATYNKRTRDCVLEAKNCIKRLTSDKYYYEYKDKRSKVSIIQLLALAYIAINDSDKLINCTIEDAFTHLIIGLYEIERGYNIDKINNDNDNIKSISICAPGTFNKIIEKLVGIHTDCTIIFINKDTVASKIRIIIREHIATYIASGAFNGNFNPDIIFSDDEWCEIWQAIKENVENAANAHYSKQIKESIIPISEWINDNLTGYDSPECLLNIQDMQKIKELLSGHKFAVSILPGSYAMATSGNLSLKDSDYTGIVNTNSSGSFAIRERRASFDDVQTVHIRSRARNRSL